MRKGIISNDPNVTGWIIGFFVPLWLICATPFFTWVHVRAKRKECERRARMIAARQPGDPLICTQNNRWYT